MFLVSLASARRVSEIHALSKEFSHPDDWSKVILEPVASFVAKTQDPSKDDRRFGAFGIPAIPKDEKGRRSKLCPVRAIREYWDRTGKIKRPTNKFFINPEKSDRVITKNRISAWIREVIYRAYQWKDRKTKGKVKAHSVRAVSASLNFTYNRSLYQVLRAGSWSRHNTFTRHYLKRFSVKKLEKFNLELGPLVAALGMVGADSSSKEGRGKE